MTAKTLTKTNSSHAFAIAVATLLFLLTIVSLRAGTITVVGLPPANTDIASGITTNKHYVSAFDYGSKDTVTYSVNGVPFTHVKTTVNNVFLVTNWVDTTHGGQVIVSVAAANHGINVTSSTPSGQADGNMNNLFFDQIFPGNGQPANGWMQEEYDNLNVGDNYSLRIYYRYQGGGTGQRLMNVYFNGEGNWQAYPGNPLQLDSGTNGMLPNGLICHGANYLEYDFTAAATNVFCLITNINAGEGSTTFAATLEDDSFAFAPFITYQASVLGIGTQIYRFNVAAVGTPSLTYQWYSNSVASYNGAAKVTDSADFSGSTTSNLTTMATTTTNELLNYYFAVVANGQGSVTSSIVQINPAATIVVQPTPTNVANSYVQFNVTAGGFLPLTYQWYSSTNNSYTNGIALTDGAGVSGSATNSLTTTTNLQNFYFVVVTNGYGAVTSAITAYNPNPVIVTQPTASKVGNSVQMSVTAKGWPTLGYQWYFNSSSSYSGASVMTDGNGVSGSTTPNLTITNLFDYYFVVITNNYGSITSQVVAAAIQLTVTAAGEPIWNTTSQTNIIITFSDTINPSTATTLANYGINNGATINSATLVASNEIALITSPLNPSTSYTLTVQNVKDLNFGILMVPSPTNVSVGLYPGNLALWVSAGTGVTADGSGNVSQWNDLSPNGNILYTISALSPQLATNAYGDPVVRFAATNSNQMDAFTSPSLGITNDISIIAVMNFATLAGGTNGEIVSKTGSGGQANIAAPYDYYVGSANATLYRGNGGSGGNGTSYGAFIATSGPSAGVPHIITVSESGNTISHYLDGNAAGTGVLSDNYQETRNTDAGNDLTIGARGDSINRLSGDISELIIAGSAVSSYDVVQLDNYLIAKHNLVFVNTNPTNIVFSASGGNLTLSWPADHTGWQLQAQTNGLSVGISSNWVNVANSAATNQIVIPMNLTNGSVFYRLVYP